MRRGGGRREKVTSAFHGLLLGPPVYYHNLLLLSRAAIFRLFQVFSLDSRHLLLCNRVNCRTGLCAMPNLQHRIQPLRTRSLHLPTKVPVAGRRVRSPQIFFDCCRLRSSRRQRSLLRRLSHLGQRRKVTIGRSAPEGTNVRSQGHQIPVLRRRLSSSSSGESLSMRGALHQREGRYGFFIFQRSVFGSSSMLPVSLHRLPDNPSHTLALAREAKARDLALNCSSYTPKPVFIPGIKTSLG